MTKNKRKVIALMMAMVMVMASMFAVTTSAFAETDGNVNVKFYVPEKYVDLNFEDQQLNHVGYTPYGTKTDLVSDETVTVYEKSGTVDLSAINTSTVALPDGFHGLYNYDSSVAYLPTAFDVIYNFAVTQKGETTSLYPDTGAAFVYGFDTPSYTEQGVRADGIFVNKLSNNGTETLDTDNMSYWLGYSWGFYAVPGETNFDPLNPDETYKVPVYANNLVAENGYTYYMIYEYSETTW